MYPYKMPSAAYVREGAAELDAEDEDENEWDAEAARDTELFLSPTHI